MKRLLRCALFFPATLFAQEPLAEAHQAITDGEFAKARSLFEEAAQDGSAAAAYNLGEAYLMGKGGEASLPKAMEWYQQAAEDGHGHALFRMGELYLQGGEGLERDEPHARFLLQSAAEAGVAQGWDTLGQLSERAARAANEKPERDRHFLEARRFYEKGAEADDPDSQFHLAQILVNADREEPDYQQSYSWLRKSALAGNVQAMSELGVRIQKGLGTEADPVGALGWFLVAAERNSPSAITNLGLCYANGIGVPVDPNHAGSWYDKAAQQGYAPAQYLIGQLFENGRGTEANPVFAYTHYFRAADSGHQLAKQARDALRPKLSPEQLQEAEALLAESNEN